jgi:hypothetical protein
VFLLALPPVGLAIAILAALRTWRRIVRRQWHADHEALRRHMGGTPDESLITSIQQHLASSPFALREWQARHAEVYAGVFAEALGDGVDAAEQRWLDTVEHALAVEDSKAARTTVLRAEMWSMMADGEVTEEEERLLDRLLTDAGLTRSDLSEEFTALDEFVRGRRLREDGLPTLDPGIRLQKGEVCHHQTTGALLERKVLRSYTRDGQRFKDEGLVRTREGDVYITSKRILLVGDGTSSIPHKKILDIEIHHDQKLIEMTKDGRQKPLLLTTPDAIYSGLLIEVISEAST